jgi:TonB family protein
MIILDIRTPFDSTFRNESVCMTLAVGLHILMLLWNPVLLSSHFRPIHDFVTVDIVEQPAPGGYVQPIAPKKMSLMDTLKDMLMKPKVEEIAHIAPEPVTSRVAAPLRPTLVEKVMPRSIAQTFTPKSEIEDIAAAAAGPIQTPTKNIVIPMAGPTISDKRFGGIRAKDLPFQIGTDQAIAGGAGGSVIPIAVGSRSAKAALGYASPTLQDAGKRRAGIQAIGVGAGAATGELGTLGAGGPANIQISGTGGTGNAPTGATRGSVLADRAGSGGGGGLVSRAMFGSGRGMGVGSGIEGIPSAAAELDAQLAAASSGAGGRAKTKKSFEIAGPLNNRAILHKVIPQYPTWAEEQGIIGSVRIWFTVAPDGSVRSNMRVTKTTGYPDLDKLATDALRQWRFAPFNVADESTQWGIITFTFSLSS